MPKKSPSEPPGGETKKIRQVANVAFVSTKTGKVLLHKRKKEKYNGVDYWAFFGGRVEKYASAIETAIKEVHEELGIILSRSELMHVCQTVAEKTDELIQRDVFLVFTDKNESEFVPQEREGEDGIYFEFEDAVELPFRNDIREELIRVQKCVEVLMDGLIEHLNRSLGVSFL